MTTKEKAYYTLVVNKRLAIEKVPLEYRMAVQVAINSNNKTKI